MAAGLAAERPSTDVLSAVDHLVYATPDLALGIARAEEELGVTATPGGQHPGRGTRNALIALGPATYLEIIGPDPDQPKPAKPRPFGIDTLKAPALVAWAAKGDGLERLAQDARRHGIVLGPVIPGSRQRPDGVVLAWRYTDPAVVVADGIVPFFIDWGATPHPSRGAAQGARLIGLRAEHPDAARVQKMLVQLGLHVPVRRAPKVALVATIDGPRGRVELR
jgi:hypothetical protein